MYLRVAELITRETKALLPVRHAARLLGLEAAQHGEVVLAGERTSQRDRVLGQPGRPLGVVEVGLPEVQRRLELPGRVLLLQEAARGVREARTQRESRHQVVFGEGIADEVIRGAFV